jgi:hypothetical protein
LKGVWRWECYKQRQEERERKVGIMILERYMKAEECNSLHRKVGGIYGRHLE